MFGNFAFQVNTNSCIVPVPIEVVNCYQPCIVAFRKYRYIAEVTTVESIITHTKTLCI